MHTSESATGIDHANMSAGGHLQYNTNIEPKSPRLKHRKSSSLGEALGLAAPMAGVGLAVAHS